MRLTTLSLLMILLPLFTNAKDRNSMITQGSTASASSTARTIHVANAGTLPTLISESEKYLITDLTLTGNLNGTDLRLVRDMVGCNYLGNQTDGKVTKLDLSEVNIVAGGEKYVDTKSISASSGNRTTNSNGFSYYTENDILGQYLFAGCDHLKEITLPNSIRAIGNNVFHFCSGLSSLVIPKNVASIGTEVIVYCENITSLRVANGNTTFTSPNGSNAVVNGTTLVLGCSGTVIPDHITTIGREAFSGAGKWGSQITLPSSVTTIEDWAFAMAAFGNIVLPDNLQTIGDYAFGWAAIGSITIPASVTHIGSSAFVDCYNLKQVTTLVEEPLTIDEKTFSSRANLDLIVPIGSLDAYKTAEYWKEFKSIQDVKGNTGSISQRSILVKTAGTLPSLISESEKYLITELTIAGNLNGADIRLIRDIAGSNYLGQSTNGRLKKLDLSEATIVAGGEKYIDTDYIYFANGSNTYGGGDFFHFNTQDYIVGDGMFAGCEWLEEILFPTNSIALGARLFTGCQRLKSIHIPQNVSSIGSYFVDGSYNISSISVADGNKTYSSPNNSHVVMKGTTLILGCKNSIIPASTTVIGQRAFESCYNLGKVTLPEGVTTIEVGAFAWSGLSEIVMPSTLTTIGNDAFAGCTLLTDFTLPKSVIHYGEGLGALKDCNNLASISVESGNPNYDARENCKAIIETSSNTLISGCKNTIIPKTVTVLGDQPFRGANLTDFEVPYWITTIGERAFFSSSLSSVKIPASVTSIGSNAFAYCYNLTAVTVWSKTPLEISENTFTDRANIDLIVPKGSVEAYKAAPYWKEFKSIVDTASPGDANGDDLVDVSDIVAIVNNILGQPGEVFNGAAADINGDGQIDVDDIVAVVNIILDK